MEDPIRQIVLEASEVFCAIWTVSVPPVETTMVPSSRVSDDHGSLSEDRRLGRGRGRMLDRNGRGREAHASGLDGAKGPGISYS